MPLSRQIKGPLIVGSVVGSCIVLVAGVILYLNRDLCETREELYFEKTGECYLKGSQGPCSNTLVFLQHGMYRNLGICSCPYTEFERAMVYDPIDDHCYLIYSQAFCEVGFWLNVTLEGYPVCERNKCLHEFKNQDALLVDEIVPLPKGKCAILNQPTEGCEENEVVQFYRGHRYPNCKSQLKKTGTASIGVPPSKCPKGSHMSSMGVCQPHFEFD